jgi:hypothetical protein
MRRIGRPSGDTALAVVALFIALGGTGYAAATIGSGQIKNNSIRGKDVRNSNITGRDVKRNSLTGSDVAESKLGKVRSATRADTAGSSAVASALTSAGASAYFPSRKVTATGVVRLPKAGTSPANSPARTLLAKGPFKVTGQCYDVGGNPEALLALSSSEPGSVLDNNLTQSIDQDIPANAAFDGTVRQLTAQAPSGATLAAQVDFAVNGFGSPCAFALSAVTHP